MAFSRDPVLVVLALMLLACGERQAPPDARETPAPVEREPPLRDLATSEDLRVGTAVRVRALRHEPRYRETVVSEFSSITPENELKWEQIHPEPDRYVFPRADGVVAFAAANDLAVRGGPLVWHQQNPGWILNGTWNRRGLLRALRDHIYTVVGRYRGKVAAWDVVNEAVDAEGRLRPSIWMRVIGPAYIPLAFRWAREADPAARLYYNDFDIEHAGPKADAVHRLVSRLKRQGVPIDGVGHQAHVTVPPPDPAELGSNLRRLNRLGLETPITEADVRLRVPATADDLRRQADAYRTLLDACLAADCDSFTTWGFTDRHSWIPQFYPGFGAALPYDAQLRPKPALLALRDVLRG